LHLVMDNYAAHKHPPSRTGWRRSHGSSAPAPTGAGAGPCPRSAGRHTLLQGASHRRRWRRTPRACNLGSAYGEREAPPLHDIKICGSRFLVASVDMWGQGRVTDRSRCLV
jgi:hypothetical protein